MIDPIIDFDSLWQAVIALPSHLSPYSVHGPDHWQRVERNALILASQSGANVSVVRLFAVFHDSCRENDDYDPDHGKRGAALATAWRGKYFDLPDDLFERLHYACTWHTDRHHHEDATIATCWDADRLDQGASVLHLIPSISIQDCQKRSLCTERSPHGCIWSIHCNNTIKHKAS